jgi:hypothetical protein
MGETMAKDERETDGRRQSARALRALAFLMLGGVGATIFFGLQHGLTVKAVLAVAVGLALGGAAGLCGGLMGFVFAIPRTLQHDQQDADTRADKSTWYQTNTNLEQISDWLTKIIIGVSLVEIKEIPALLKRVAAFAGPGLGGAEAGESFAVFIILHFVVAGFLFGYLWTRLYMAGALRTADTTSFGQRFASVERKLEALRTREEFDARALNLLQRQLEANEDEPPIPQKDLDAAIAACSNAARSTIFREAEKLRRSTWEDAVDKPKMERTIPIFKALINANPNYHRDHAQLGYALKDQRIPQLEESKEKLTKAIELRGAWQHNGYVMYELNRAACEILLEKQRGHKVGSPAEVRSAILEDLKVAAEGGLRKLISTDPLFQTWLKANDVTEL